MKKEEKKQLITRTSYQEHQKQKKHTRKPLFKKKERAQEETANQPDFSDKGRRLSAKEQGRRLDVFYNWAILAVILAIILVFVLAFVI